ncbi:hypothetical protein FTX61_03615 [Nitriliruptoraceae bacterium ZYF776]|nr:hypothetical protein [Profundirhabdus halotolerans]
MRSTREGWLGQPGTADRSGGRARAPRRADGAPVPLGQTRRRSRTVSVDAAAPVRGGARPAAHLHPHVP